MVACAIVTETCELLVHSGKRYLRLKATDLVHYRGERGRRGNKLPRGFQNVDSLAVESIFATEVDVEPSQPDA